MDAHLVEGHTLNNTMNIKYEERNIKLEEYKLLRHAVGWWDTDDSATQKALDNSLYSIAAVSDGKIVGMGRVIGDDGLYYYVQDLIVHPDYQSKGIGREIMSRLLNYINTNAKKGAFIGLMAAKGLKGYYQKFGFTPRPEDSPGMYDIKQ